MVYHHWLTSATTLCCQDFAKDEWEEMHFGIRDTMDIVKAVLVEGMDRAISAKTVTYDFARLMDGAKEVKCSQFAQEMIKHMG